MAYLQLKDIHKSYILNKNEEFPVLKGISLDFDKGEFVSILGESGGGKSTLMNIIGGLDHDYEGDVILDGHSTRDFTEKQMDAYRRQTIGFIFQSFNLISHLTVLDNVLVSLDMTTLSHAEKEQRAKELLEQVGLSQHIKKHPNQLSGGQKQRVAIARALASDPDIIIADEPTGALDSKNTDEILEIMEGIAKSGKLVIAVTHSEEVARFGTRIVHMSDGVIDKNRRNRDKYALPEPESDQRLVSKKLGALAAYKNAYKHTMYYFWRNFLIMLGTGIGIFAVLLFSGLGNGISAFISDQISSMINPTSVSVMRNPSGKKMSQAEFTSSLRQFASNPSALLISKGDLNKLRSLKNVNAVQPGYQFGQYTLTLPGQKTPVSASGLQTWTRAFASSTVKNGRKPGQNEIVIDRAQAQTFLGTKKYRQMIGKTVTLSFTWINQAQQPVVVRRNLKVSGLANGGQAGAVTATNYGTMRTMLKSAGAITDPNFVSVNADSIDVTRSVAKQVNNIRSKGKYAFGAITVGDILNTVSSYVRLATNVLAAIAAISLVVSALMIIVSMYMSVSERTKEIGVLRALGEGKRDISRLFTGESVLIGLFSAVLALILAFGIGAIANKALYGLAKANMVIITPGNVIFAFVIAIVISFLAALLPARRAAKLDPIESLAAE
ncbi:ABC transporter ATP-binding protein/permease [Oenococcus kitaharae]|uniref:ABC-type antimicrobial peptide transport system ATPase component n=1 Tax=Oenococcus kitaharae DSM 17330 TaxID=1045004 RepID=G9WJA9_9LACO|nr:ABC transporter ATP-binding protein/permease [Oenococcus kitaharae]EHN58715.1 ABC-type antimicrobial peptide transport system ATPase component [Oenococcus kitaharae DSM 17330]OEY83202.1 ABC transporter ATP-binding protein [Oenococcus kitaharae]OEY84276.1 ABC transporter ATP-binding protein [Oenococcus kitaharae]OEY85882.1 ABC transporter ATP-binding protein [Oenococcus kitaharae]